MQMSRIENSLTRIETGLRAIIEGNLARDGFPRKLHQQLIRSLGNAMQESVNRNAQGDKANQVKLAPDQYTLILPDEQAQIIFAHPAELDRLAQKLVNLAAKDNIVFSASPILRMVADPTMLEVKVLVDYSHIEPGDSLTTELDELSTLPVDLADAKIPNAFLIVNGLSTFPISQSVINIGSDSENHLVLKDARVSRKHAQLRLNVDHFVIFDLDSRNGTFVNGVAISNHVLNPGDVINLAGVPIVYGQEALHHTGYTRKLPNTPNAPEIL